MKKTIWVAALLVLCAAFLAVGIWQSRSNSPGSQLIDASDGRDWPGYGRTYGEQHFSPLEEINTGTVAKLGLVWAFDLPPGNPVSQPIAVDGVLYTSTGYSVVRAFDAASGKLRWTFDPHAPEAAGRKLREGWGSRGLAWWNGKIYIGTQDGRLIAIDARSGQQVWSTMTLDKDDYRFISGAPRVFDGKVIIGHGGADAADTRGYVTTYDAETGKQLWRFYTVPGDPAKGFENPAMAMAAKTWAGPWWKHGGGGTVWNAMTYDPETRTIFIGTGNGAPYNHEVRSQGKGDNLFLCSIVALDADSGEYKWHYQINPAENWDYNAAMDMHLADLSIGGKPRKVLIQAPKNGFLYVIDRVTGELLSAEPIARVNWASRIDLKTGRPVENPAARFPNGTHFAMMPGAAGAHGWAPSAYSPVTGLIYIPVNQQGYVYSTAGIDPKKWTRSPGNVIDGAEVTYPTPSDKLNQTGLSELLAWDPVRQKQLWRLQTGGPMGAGVLATGGGLIFQGRGSGGFYVYDARTGKVLWRLDLGVPVMAPPITYVAGGRQYVTVLTGISTSMSFRADLLPFSVDFYTQPRRVLTFALGGTEKVSPGTPHVPKAVLDPAYKPNAASETRGGGVYGHCITCHGINVVSGGSAPDLRASSVPASADAFAQVVRGGALVPAGMPRFEELSDGDLADLRAYIQARSHVLATQSVAQDRSH